MKQLKTVKNKDFKYLGSGGADIFLDCLNSESKTMSVLYPAHKSQRLFNTFGVIPDDIIIIFIYKIFEHTML